MGEGIDGELAELLKQVGWAKGEEFKAELRKAIENYGSKRWSEGYDHGFGDGDQSY